MRWFVLVSLLGSPALADVCLPIGSSRVEVQCIDDDMFSWFLGETSSAKLGYLLNEVRIDVGMQPGDVLVVDVGYRIRAARTVTPTGATRLLVNPLPPLSWWDHLYGYWARSYGLRPLRTIPLTLGVGQVSSGLGIRVEDTGVNTDGQLLYGPPGGWAEWGCTGYGSVDTCKACCMASRTTMLGAIWGVAKTCHAWANTCAAVFGVGVAACHVGCGIVEAAAIGALLYSTGRCNGNCEKPPYWNDTSIDWSGSTHQNRLTGYHECLGWVRGSGRVEINGSEHISIPGVKLVHDTAGPQRVKCVVLHEGDVWHEIPGATETRVLGRPVECPPATTPEHGRFTEGDHAGIMCLIAEDYRVVDNDRDEPYDQTPFVGVLQVEDDRVYIDRIEGGPLYLDMPTHDDYLWLLEWGLRIKVAVRGHLIDNTMVVTDIREINVWW